MSCAAWWQCQQRQRRRQRREASQRGCKQCVWYIRQNTCEVYRLLLLPLLLRRAIPTQARAVGQMCFSVVRRLKQQCKPQEQDLALWTRYSSSCSRPAPCTLLQMLSSQSEQRQRRRGRGRGRGRGEADTKRIRPCAASRAPRECKRKCRFLHIQ